MSMPQTPPAAPKKASPLIFIVVGIVGFLFLLACLGAVGAWYAIHKVKEVASSPASLVKTILSMNPNVDVISTDEGKGTVTIKDKQTGKIVTMNFDDVKNGKLTFKEEGKDAVTIETKADGGSITAKSAEGTVQFGGGDLKLPSWMPAYPGSSPKTLTSSQMKGGNAAMFTFTTKDSPEKTSQFYADAFKTAGFKVNTVSAPGGVASVQANDGEKRTAVVTIMNTGETTVSVQFEEKP